MTIIATYDPEADALYVRLRDGERARTVELDDTTTYVDVDSASRVVGLELLYPSLGLNLSQMAHAFALENQLPEIIAAINEAGAPGVAPTMTGGQHLASTSIVMTASEGTIAAATGMITPTAGQAPPLVPPLVTA